MAEHSMCQPGRPAPQGEAHPGSPLLADLDPGPGAQVVHRLSGQGAVARELAHAVIHVAAFCPIGVAALEQRLDHAPDLRHVGGRARLVARFHDAQLCRVLVHGPDEARAERRDVFVVLPHELDDLVVNVGDVADVRDLEPARAQIAHRHVEHHHHARVPQVAVVVHRHAADIHADPAGDDRDKRLFFLRQDVVDVKCKTSSKFQVARSKEQAGWFLATCYLLLATCYLLLATCYLLLATCYLLLATCYLLLATCYLLLATCYLLLAA